MGPILKQREKFGLDVHHIEQDFSFSVPCDRLQCAKQPQIHSYL